MSVVDFNSRDLIFAPQFDYNDDIIMRNIDRYLEYRKGNIKIEGFAFIFTIPSFIFSLRDSELSKVDNLYELYCTYQLEHDILPKLSKKEFITQLKLYGCGFQRGGNTRVVSYPIRLNVERE